MTPVAGSATTCVRVRETPVRRRSCIVVCALLFFAAHAMADDEWEYEVRRGETLWSITLRYLKGMSYLEPLQKLNGVEHPRQLPPGLRLRMPFEWTRSATANARLVAVTGDVLVEPASGAPPFRAGLQRSLATGDRVITAHDGNALIEFVDGSLMMVLGDSSVRLKALRSVASGAGDAHVEIERGRTESAVQPRADRGTRFRIETPAGVTSVRGTEFRVSAERETMRAEVTAGSVGIDAAGTGVRVAAGYGTRVRAGQAPEAPRALLPAPDLSAIPRRLEHNPSPLAVPALPGARAYRLQVARGTRFEEIVVDDTFETMPLLLPELANGPYLLRVRGIDAVGLEGIHTDRSVEIDARPDAPALNAPRDDDLIPDGRPVLRWHAQGERLRYHVQIARDAAFTDLLVDQEALADESFTPDGQLPPGRYYWRVSAHHSSQGEGPFADARSFRRPPTAPHIEALRLTPATLAVTWSEAEGAQAYEVEMARDVAPDTPVFSERLSGVMIEVPRPQPARYVVRARALDALGEPGPLSDAIPVDVRPPPAPPQLLAPAAGDELRARQPLLSWQAMQGLRYRLQLAAGEGFDMPVFDVRDLDASQWQVPRHLMPGRYRWRVAAASEVDGDGAFGPPAGFRVLGEPPARLASRVHGADLFLSWSGGQDAPGYRVQLARDADFHTLLFDRQVRGNELRVQRPAAGAYFFRVTALDAQGEPGPFSGPHAVKVAQRYPFWLLPLVPLLFLL